MTMILTRRPRIGYGMFVASLGAGGRIEFVTGEPAMPVTPQVYEVTLFDDGAIAGTHPPQYSAPIVKLRISGQDWETCDRAGCAIHEVLLAPRLPARFRPHGLVGDRLNGRVLFDALPQVMKLDFPELRRMLHNNVGFGSLCHGLPFAERHQGPFEVDVDHWGAFVGQALLLAGHVPPADALAFCAGEDVAVHLTASVWDRFRATARRLLSESRPSPSPSPTAWEFTVAISGYGRNRDEAWRRAVDAFSDDPGEPHTMSCAPDSPAALQRELRDLFIESLDAWTDEDESVQQEHADLIGRMRSLCERLPEAAVPANPGRHQAGGATRSDRAAPRG